MSTFPIAPLVATGLVGGFAVARYTGRRELGGVVLAAAGGVCDACGCALRDPASPHALFFSENAVALETALHQRLSRKRVNLVNPRRSPGTPPRRPPR
ncbi:MAG: hypothetical protein M3291_14390 [Actinomycetota bacterium]|nr:hypothetical protein [Actinomycetota bacterium]